MPLYKRKPYPLSKPPSDLKPDETVFTVRFTGEIFRSYEHYLKRINMYRKRHWTCKVTGKGNLTYEEAIMSEQKANEQIQQFPAEYIGPVVTLVQHSQLRLEDLVDSIYRKFKEQFVAGEEVDGVRDDDLTVHRCKILEVLIDENEDIRYKVRWLDPDEGGSDTEEKEPDVTIESSASLMRKKHPLKKELLKVFIREVAELGPTARGRKAPWIVDDKLAARYNLPTEFPEDSDVGQYKKVEAGEVLEGKRVHKKRKIDDEEIDLSQLRRKRKVKSDEDSDGDNADGHHRGKKARPEKKREPKIVYPIEDTLVKPGSDDPPFNPRPTPSFDYHLPLECIGDLCMIWDFCATFSRALHLSYFSLDDFELTLESRSSCIVLLAETHTALLRTALSEKAAADEFYGRRKMRGGEVSVQTWVDDICHFVDTAGMEEVRPFISQLKRGHYGSLEPRLKIEVLKELVLRCLGTELIRSQLEENLQAMEMALAEKRGEEAEAKRRRKEQMEKKTTTTGAEEGMGNGGEAWEGRGGDEEAMGRGLGDGAGDVPNGASDLDDAGIGGWQRKGRRRGMNGATPVPHVMSASDLTASEDGRSVDGWDERDTPPGSCSVRRPSRQETLRRAAQEREAREAERKSERKELARITAEKRKVQLEAAAERKQKELEDLAHQRKLEALDREVFEKHTVRTNPLGRDRDLNRYWFFHRDGRFFVEDKDSTRWGFYSSTEELDLLFGSLNPKGIRERALQAQLQKHYARISAALGKKAKEATQRLAVEAAEVRRSSRVKSVPKQAPFLSYVNKLSIG